MKKQIRPGKFRSFLRWALWILLVQFILLNISASLYAYKLTHFYENKTLRKPAAGQNIFVKTWRLFTGPHFVKSTITSTPIFPYDTVTLHLPNETPISGWYIPADSLQKGTVLLFHGIMSNKSQLLTEANDFHHQGYNVLLIDFRAYGESGGVTTTIGAKEALEVKMAYDYIKTKGEDNIYCYGVSMGAVCVMKAVAEYNLQPSGIILDMPFQSMQKHLQARARLIGFEGFPEKPFSFLVTGWISIERGFNAYKYDAVSYAKKITCPVLLQWGSDDPIVLKSETDKIFDNIASAHKKRITYKQAGHESFLRNDAALWRNEVENFLSQFKN